MNLVGRYLHLGIEGIAVSELRTILLGGHNITVKMATNGMIMLSTKKIIKCVSHYYEHPVNKINVKASNQCFYVQQALNVEGVPSNACARCHLVCMRNQEAKQIYRKK